MSRVVNEVAGYLGNTPAVARASYVDPRVIEAYERGRTIGPALGRLGADAAFGHLATHGGVERAVISLLRDPAGRAREKARRERRRRRGRAEAGDA